MYVISVNNVNEALVEGCRLIGKFGREKDSRNGRVLVLPAPLATVYKHPNQRVMCWPERDANPFFHLMEALWMLHGDRDLAWPRTFNSGFGQYSDNGETLNGAYGWRWRQHFGSDQLRSIVNALRANPECRRQVLTMWDATRDLGASSKDIPCNLQATFQINDEGRLDMMVTNRSNDMIWGAYGANAVHFSMLLEYMAAAIGVPMGTYTQVSANTHVYKLHWDLMKKLASRAPEPPSKLYRDTYENTDRQPLKLVNIPIGRWERELDSFMKLQHRASYVDPIFEHVAKPMWCAYAEFSDKSNPSRFSSSLHWARQIIARDWQAACIEWLERRETAARLKETAA